MILAFFEPFLIHPTGIRVLFTFLDQFRMKQLQPQNIVVDLPQKQLTRFDHRLDFGKILVLTQFAVGNTGEQMTMAMDGIWNEGLIHSEQILNLKNNISEIVRTETEKAL